MQVAKWLERVLDSLRENGIPERQQLRLLEELQDHITDLQEENMNGMDSQNIEQRMGSPESLAGALAESYRRERLLVRQPWLAWLAFSLGPVTMHFVLTMCLSLVVPLILFFPFLAPGNIVSEEALNALNSAWQVAMGIMGPMTGIGVTAWFCMAARRNRVSWRLPLLGCATVAIGSPVLFDEMIEPPFFLWIVAFATAAASLATWYWMAWRGQRWKTAPISISRHFPLLMSSFGSLAVAVLCLGTYLLLVASIVLVLEEVCGIPRAGNTLRLVALSCRFVPFALAAYLCWRMTQRCHRQLCYSFVACFCVAVIATVFLTDVSSEGQWNFSFGLVGSSRSLNWGLIAQFLAPLLIWAVLIVLSRHQLRPKMTGAVPS